MERGPIDIKVFIRSLQADDMCTGVGSDMYDKKKCQSNERGIDDFFISDSFCKGLKINITDPTLYNKIGLD